MKFFVLICHVLSFYAYAQELPPKFRLQHNVIPKSYNLKLKPIWHENIFEGEVTIFVELQQSLKNISLNSKDLQILNLVLDTCIDNTGYELIETDELLNIFYTDQEYIDPGEHFIYAKFKGKLYSESQGFFKTIDGTEDKNVVSLATSFSASNARMVFPCLDEPVYRSKFTVRLIKPDESYTALSNMEEIGSFKTDEGIVVDFRTTVPISPYLLCFAITKLNSSSTTFRSRDGRTIPIRIFMVDEYLEQTPFLLNVVKNSLQYFEEYTALPYPSSKLDFIELKNYSIEGMENVGLVTLEYNLVSFNISGERPKIDHQKSAAQLLTHETVHMWFGDIVTPYWYNDLWLAEGFTEYLTNKGLDHQFSKWHLVDDEAVMRHKYSYQYDLEHSKGPIVNFPDDNEHIENQFGVLTYTKGAAVVAMLEMAMGEEPFKLGIREFLKNKYFDVATTSDFITTMQKFAPELNLLDFLQSWLYQNRHPMVIVANDNSSDNYILRQTNFFISPDSKSIFGHKWTIPITYISSCNKSIQLKWFNRDANEVYIPRCGGEKWIKFNPGAVGYYRMLYTEEQYDAITKHFEELDEVDQAHLIEESFHQVKKLQISCKVPIKLIGKLKGKNNLMPLQVSVMIFKRMLSDATWNFNLSVKLKNYFTSIFKDLYHSLTWTVNLKDDFTVRMLRSNLLPLMCETPLRYEKCEEDVKELEKAGTEIHPDVIRIYKSVLKDIKDYPIMVGNGTTQEGIINNSIKTPSKKSHKHYIENCATWAIANL